jgi:hypothetical protein
MFQSARQNRNRKQRQPNKVSMDGEEMMQSTHSDMMQ